MKTAAILLIALLTLTTSSCSDTTNSSIVDHENTSDVSEIFESDDNIETSEYDDLWVDESDSTDKASKSKKNKSAASPSPKDSDSGTAQPPTPATAPATAPADAPQGKTVYVTPSGKKYHNANCRTIRGNAQAIDLNSALSKGYTPCKICH